MAAKRSEYVTEFTAAYTKTEVERRRANLQAWVRALTDHRELLGFTRLLDMSAELVEDDRVVLSAPIDETSYNIAGTVHGGWIVGLGDSAMGCAFATKLAPGMLFTTIEVSSRFVRPTVKADRRLIADGRVIYRGRTMGICTAEVRTEDGRLVAKLDATNTTIDDRAI